MPHQFVQNKFIQESVAVLSLYLIQPILSLYISLYKINLYNNLLLYHYSLIFEVVARSYNVCLLNEELSTYLTELKIQEPKY